MEPTPDPTPNPTPEQLYEQAVAHYRAARWSEALEAISALLAQGQSTPDVDALLQDIKFKQRLDRGQPPAASVAPPPRRNGRGPLLGLAGGLALAAALGLGFVATQGRQAATLIGAAPVTQGVAEALPTASALLPTATAAPAAPAQAGAGTLVISAALEQELALGIDNVYLILDASGSMLAPAGERRKIDIAQEALVGLVERLPADVNVALRTYGRQRPDDCGDVELLVPLGPLDRTALVSQIEAIEPVNLSRTPIGSSLAAVPGDLGDAGGETLVLLVSDGEESCDGDPVSVAAQLHAERPNLRVSVVGFDIAPELRERLARIAEAGGGSYYGADDVGQLAAALRDVVTPRFRVLDAAGAEVGAGQVGEQLDLPAGAYTVAVGANPVLLQQPVQVRDGMATTVALRTDQGQLLAEVRRDWQP